MKTENVLVVFHFQTFLYLFQINVLFLRLQKTLQKNLYFSDVSIKYRKGALAWKALLKGKCFGKDYFLVNQSAEIMYMYRTTNHWSNRTENWVSNIKDVYQKKENHPPREKGKGIKLRRIQSIEKELWSVTKTTKKKQKVLLNLQNHQTEPLNQKTYQFNNISMKFESEKLCCLNNAKIIQLAALISDFTVHLGNWKISLFNEFNLCEIDKLDTLHEDKELLRIADTRRFKEIL